MRQRPQVRGTISWSSQNLCSKQLGRVIQVETLARGLIPPHREDRLPAIVSHRRAIKFRSGRYRWSRAQRAQRVEAGAACQFDRWLRIEHTRRWFGLLGPTAAGLFGTFAAGRSALARTAVLGACRATAGSSRGFARGTATAAGERVCNVGCSPRHATAARRECRRWQREQQTEADGGKALQKRHNEFLEFWPAEVN